jgi:hypothetical protein
MLRVRTAQDGNCFYHALLYTLWSKKKWDSDPQKTNPVEFSRDDINRVKGKLRETFQNLEPEQKQLLEIHEKESAPLEERLRPCETKGCQPNCWATDAEIRLASRSFGRQICIRSKSNMPWVCISPHGDEEYMKTAPDDPGALLIFYTGNHYDALIRRPPQAAPVDRRKEQDASKRTRDDRRKKRDAFKRGAALGVVALALGLAALRRRP